MEAIDRLKSQIENLLSKLERQREENSELRGKLLRVEAENRAKDEYIKTLEQKIVTVNEGFVTPVNLDAKG